MTDTFQTLGVSEEVCVALAGLGITEPFAVQRMCIPAGLEGTDVIAKSPTGSGKTLAFGLPLIMLADPDATAPEALVLCPTRELAQQIGADLEPLAAARGVRVAVCYGGAGAARPGASAASRSQIVIATPGRLIDLSGRRMVDLSGVRRLVLDEADRMVDMGFLPQVERIVPQAPERPPDALLLGHARGGRGRRGPPLHPKRRPHRRERPRHRRAGRRRPRVHLGHRGGEVRPADRPPGARQGADACLLRDEDELRLAGPAARGHRRALRGHPRRPQPGGAEPGDVTLRER